MIARIESRKKTLSRRLARAASLTLALGLAATSCAQSSSSEEIAWEAFTRAAPPEATEHYLSSTNPDQVLDIYSPPGSAAKSSSPRPVLLLVHGGGFTGGSRDLLAPHARYFAARGWVCINVGYRLAHAPEVTIQNSAEDVRAAFAWVRGAAAKRGWDAKHVVAFGESAGGQLACALGILPPDPQRWRVQSLVLVNPVLDLTTLSWAQNLPGVKEGGPIDPKTMTQHPAYVASPLFHLTPESPPILVVHGRKDASVPFSQAEALVARGRTAGVKVELVTLEDTGHAFLLREYGKPEQMRAVLKRIADFLGAP